MRREDELPEDPQNDYRRDLLLLVQTLWKDVPGIHTWEDTLSLARKVSDYAIILRALIVGTARLEPLGKGIEICVNGLRHFVSIDPAGCPELHDGVRSELAKRS